MFSYVLIDSGLEMVNAEIRYFMTRRRDAIERAQQTKLQQPEESRYNNISSKS